MNRLSVRMSRVCLAMGSIVLALASTAPAAPPTGTGVGIGARWVQTLAEDFNGTTIDSSLWTVRDVDGRPNGNHGVTWGWDPDNVSVQDGKLVIATTDDGDGTYSSGNIWTKDKWSQTYGYFEARIQLPPTVSGSQAAFWMTAQDNGHFTVGNDGRDGAEIDIMETPDASDHYRTGLHWDGYGSEHKSAGAQHSAPGIHDGYHDFGLYWDANTLRYYYDGQLKRTYTGVGVPRVAEVIQASVGILDWVDGNITTATLPVETRFDHIYAWQLQTEDSLVVIDDEAPQLNYIGDGWTQQGAASDYLGTMSQSGAAGDAVELTFEGAAVDVFIRKGSYGGIIDVYLDGQLVLDDFDTYVSLRLCASAVQPPPKTRRKSFVFARGPSVRVQNRRSVDLERTSPAFLPSWCAPTQRITEN
jgi:beta-glucanase (GH16 family)